MHLTALHLTGLSGTVLQPSWAGESRDTAPALLQDSLTWQLGKALALSNARRDFARATCGFSAGRIGPASAGLFIMDKFYMGGVGPGSAFWKKVRPAFIPSREVLALECLLAHAEVTADAVGEPLRELALLMSCWPLQKLQKHTRAPEQSCCAQLLASLRTGLHERMARCRELAACDRESARKCDRNTARAPESRAGGAQSLPFAKQP